MSHGSHAFTPLSSIKLSDSLTLLHQRSYNHVVRRASSAIIVQCMLGFFSCFRNPPNSDLDYRQDVERAGSGGCCRVRPAGRLPLVHTRCAVRPGLRRPLQPLPGARQLLLSTAQAGSVAGRNRITASSSSSSSSSSTSSSSSSS